MQLEPTVDRIVNDVMDSLKKGFKGLLEMGEMLLNKGTNVIIGLLVLGVIFGVAVGGTITLGGTVNTSITEFGNTVSGYFGSSGTIITTLGIIVSLVIVAVLMTLNKKNKGDQ